jgi:hypothetical protein
MLRAFTSLACLAVLLGAFAAQAAAQAKAPRELAGFVLGSDVAKYQDKLYDESKVPIWGQEYLHRAQLHPMQGIRSGYLTYGTCAVPGRILRIKVSYEDESLGFFNKLLDALKSRYGKDPEWRGDAFGTLRVWKWSVDDGGGNSVSIILEYYSGDDGTHTPGNSIRLSVPGWMDQEESCYKAKGRPETERKKVEDTEKKLGLDYFLPR